MKKCMTGIRTAFLLLCLLIFFGCKSELYQNLPEREINEMISLLTRHGIEGNKVARSKSDNFDLTVAKKHFADAVDILSSGGYPRRNHQDIGALFQKSGLIPTPFEEHVRYVYGLGQELSETISRLDGVVDNRVHIAISQDETLPGKASVFIKYDDRFNFDALTPRIRKLVADSVETIVIDNVDVLALPARNRQLYELPAEELRSGFAGWFVMGGIYISLFVFVILLVRAFFIFSKRQGSRKQNFGWAPSSGKKSG